jgi:CspA family cold shock protein
MHSGRINKIIRHRGFGFIRDVDGRDIFFNLHSLVGINFEELSEDQKVEYDVEKSFKGPCAFNVKLVP